MKYLLLLILVITNFISAVINPKKKLVVGPAISIDLGMNSSAFDAQRRKICEDTGLIKGGYVLPDNTTFISSGEEDRGSFFEHNCSDYDGECTKRTKYTRGPLASMHSGVFIDMTRYFAIC